MRIERKLLSQCTLEDFMRLHPKNSGCYDECGNTSCTMPGCKCVYFGTKDSEAAKRRHYCAFFDIIEIRTLEDVKRLINYYGDISVRLEVKGKGKEK